MSAILAQQRGAVPSLPDAVIFDLDGTLLDTAPDLIAALNAVRLDHRREPMAEVALRQFVSQGGRRLLREGFPELDGAAIEGLLPSFLQYYRNAIAAHTKPYAGVLEMLAALASAGVRWGIVTNKPIGLTHALLAEIGWSGRTQVVIGGDSLAERKPHPLPVHSALQQLNADPARSWMVGDDRRDIEAGRAAGCRTLIAHWGYLDGVEAIASWQADGIVAQPLDLLRWWMPDLS